MGPYKKSFYKSDIVYILLLTFKEILILYLFIKFNIFADLLYYRILRLMDKKTLKFFRHNASRLLTEGVLARALQRPAVPLCLKWRSPILMASTCCEVGHCCWRAFPM